MLLKLTGSSCSGKSTLAFSVCRALEYQGRGIDLRRRCLPRLGRLASRDPHHRPEVIIEGSGPGMAWHRRTGWTAEDPWWRTHLLDTTGQPVAESVDQVQRWVHEQRDAHRAGQLPLSHGWTDETSLSVTEPPDAFGDRSLSGHHQPGSRCRCCWPTASRTCFCGAGIDCGSDQSLVTPENYVFNPAAQLSVVKAVSLSAQVLPVIRSVAPTTNRAARYRSIGVTSQIASNW
jgi:hypothetical protein